MNDEDFTIEEQCQIAESTLDGLIEEDEIKQKNIENESIYTDLLNKYTGNHEQALFEYCFINNICYVTDIYKLLTKNRESDVYAQFPDLYVNTIKADFRYEKMTFFEQLRIENFNKVYSDVKFLADLTEDDKKNRQQIIDIFSYDPFKTEPLEDRSQLYRDLAGMTTDAMRKDVAKQKAALSIVRSYGNIEKYQRKVAELTSSGSVDDDTQKQLDQYLNVISKIQATINQTAEKNNFTVKGIGSNGKGMLSDVMNQIEEMGIDEGITNFYDIETSKSIEEVANISFKAQLNQVNLSKTDYADILNQQCEIVRNAQRTAQDALEAARLAKEKIVKQELIDELIADYKKKGISEEEITEFIKREYRLYDGVE